MGLFDKGQPMTPAPTRAMRGKKVTDLVKAISPTSSAWT